MVTSVNSTTTPAASTTGTAKTSASTNGTNTSRATAQKLVTSLGSGSGVDINSLAENLANAEIAPKQSLIQGRIDKSNATISGYSALNYVLGKLQTAFGDLKDKSDYQDVTASSSQPSLVNVSNISAPMAAGHQVVVTQLAQSQRTISAGFAATDMALNGQQPLHLTVTLNGVAHDISVNKDTPTGIVGAINAETNLGIKASLVNDGSQPTPWRILLTGPTGADQKFNISNTLGMPSMTTLQGGANRTESNAVTFHALAAHQSVTLGGLTFTPNSDVTAGQVAQAFSGLSDGSTGTPVDFGDFNGSLQGWSSSTINPDGTVTFTSSTPNANVADLSTTSNVPHVSVWENKQDAQNALLMVDGVPIQSASNSVIDAISGLNLDLYATTSTEGVSINISRDTSKLPTKIQTLVSAYNDAIAMLGVVSDPKSTVDTYGASLVGNSIVTTVRNQIRALVSDISQSSDQGLKLRDIGVTLDKTGQLQLDSQKLNAAIANNYDDVVTLFCQNQEGLTKYSPTYQNNANNAGVAGKAYLQLNNLLDPLILNGTLATLTKNQSDKISTYQKQLDDMQSRLQVIYQRYMKQFTAMDSLVGQIKSTQTSLKNSFDGMMATYTNKG